MRRNRFDLIGDIHGHYDELKALLETMGYKLINGCYSHPDRNIIFLGDFIDRGPKQREVLNTVIPMVQQGEALAVMGNHEFNALAFHTQHPENLGSWLRPRNNRNLQQHLQFLEEYLPVCLENELKKVLNFFWSLPLWLDLDGLRVVHACWDPLHVATLNNNKHLSIEMLVEASTKGTKAYHAIEALLKGVEYDLPNNGYFLDKDNFRRYAIRTQWWTNDDCTVGDIAFESGILDEKTKKIPVSANDLIGYPGDAKPVFIGHYWLEGAPELMAPNVACLDYSIAKGGKLVAYRWDGEQILSNEKIIHAQ